MSGKENEVALQRAEMRMVRWMCNVKVNDRVPSKELREILGIDDIILILQQNRLRWYGHVLRKEDTDWVKKCMEYKVEGSRPRGRPKRTWREVVQKECQLCPAISLQLRHVSCIYSVCSVFTVGSDAYGIYW